MSEWGYRQLLQQRLYLLQIARVEALSEPPVNRSQQFARLLHLALVTPEASEAHGGAQFPGFGLLLAGHCESTLEVRFCFRGIPLRRFQREFTANPLKLNSVPPFLGSFACYYRFVNATLGVIELTETRVSFG